MKIYMSGIIYGKNKGKKDIITSIYNSKEKAFWIKITQNELPTLDNLAIRKPKIYSNHQKCPLCLAENETREHLFRCPATQKELEDIWTKTEEKFLNMDDKKDNHKLIQRVPILLWTLFIILSIYFYYVIKYIILKFHVITMIHLKFITKKPSCYKLASNRNYKISENLFFFNLFFFKKKSIILIFCRTSISSNASCNMIWHTVHQLTANFW